VIRPACATDVDAVQRMAARFLSAEGPYADRFQADPERIAALVAYLTQATDGAAGFIAEQDGQAVGMFGVFSLEHPITGQRVASELCWWMEPEARGSRVGLELLRAAEGWAKDHGAVWMEMIAPSARVAQFYERLGYERTDVHYLKRL
jgi:GNAT superfamily N-acetyltransferase